jgi:hypothetical protein
MINQLFNKPSYKVPIITISKKVIQKNNNKNKFTFVHPTKCGGTSVEQFLEKYYSKYFFTNLHLNKCENNNNSILIVRDPVDRFKSMYKYWKNGSEIFIHKNYHINKFKNVNIKTFIKMLQNNSNVLYNNFLKNIHYKPISYWIHDKYKNIIIVKYCKDLNIPFQKIINFLKIPNLNIPIPHINISKNKEKIILDEEDLEFIKKYFKTDYELIELINTNPKIFRGVF